MQTRSTPTNFLLLSVVSRFQIRQPRGTGLKETEMAHVLIKVAERKIHKKKEEEAYAAGVKAGAAAVTAAING